MKTKNEFNDYELVYLYRCGEQKAFMILKEKHTGAVMEVANHVVYACFYLNKEDVVQELNYAFLKAIEGYSERKGRFFSFLYACLQRYGNQMMREYFGQSESAFYKAVSLDNYCSEDENILYIEQMESDYQAFDPIWQYQVKEAEELYGQLCQELTQQEAAFFALYKSGMKQIEISKKYDLPVRKVRNSISRAKKKMAKLIEK